MTAAIEGWIGNRCRAASLRYISRDAALVLIRTRGRLPWMPLVEWWFLVMAAWVVGAVVVSLGAMILRELVLVSRLKVSGVIEGISGCMLILNGVIMEWSTSALMRGLLLKVVAIDVWVYSSITIGLLQLLFLRFGGSSKRSIVTASAFIWWATMAMRLYEAGHGFLLTHSQLIVMSGATATALFLLRFDTEQGHGQSGR